MVNHQLNILLHIADGVMVVDRQGKVLLANPASSKLFQRPINDLVHADFGFPISVDETSEIQIVQHREEKPNIITVEMRSVEIIWDATTAWLVSLRDITIRKNMENQLREVNRLNHVILNSLHASIAVLDMNGKIIQVNDMWTKFAMENGDPDGTMTGVGINYFNVCRASDDDYSQMSLQGMLSVVNGEQAGFDMLYPCHAPHEKRWFIMRVKPLHDEKIHGLVVSHINVTSYYSMMDVYKDEDASSLKLENSQLEFLALELLSYPSATPLLIPPMTETQRDIFVRLYTHLLRDIVEQRTYRIEHHITQRAEALSENLAQHWVHPRELVKIHAEVLKAEYAKQTAQMKQVYTEEGRILLLQVMGYLAAQYRQHLLSSSPPEQTN